MIKADKIFDGNQFLDAGAVLVLNDQNELKEIFYAPLSDNTNVEYHPGIVCPGFVNAHCHLELSHFLGAIPQHSGLPAFAQKIVQLRAGFQKEVIREQIQIWDRHMYQQGIVAVGDICNTDDTFEVKKNSPIFYHSFIELIGLNHDAAESIFARGILLYEQLNALGLKGSPAPHALYSTSLRLIQLIVEFNNQQQSTTSIHLDESIEEHKFLDGAPSGFDHLYKHLGIDLSWYQAPKQYGLSLLSGVINHNKWLTVHNTFSPAESLTVKTANNAIRCFCPNANLYIENQLPDFKHLTSAAKTFCIGTDSLASNHHLDMVSEMNVLKKYSPFSDEEILRASTANGALALGLEQRFGKLIPGKNAGLNQLQLHANEFKFIKKLA